MRQDIQALQTALNTAVAELGASHAAVEAARLDFKMLREQLDRKIHEQDQEKYELEVTRAVAEASISGLRAALKGGGAVLGLGHPIMQKGKEELSRMTKSEGHTRRERVETRHTAAIADAIEAGDSESLKQAMKAAAGAIGPNHPEVTRRLCRRECTRNHVCLCFTASVFLFVCLSLPLFLPLSAFLSARVSHSASSHSASSHSAAYHHCCLSPLLPLTLLPLTVLPLTVLPLTVLPLTVHPLTVLPLTVLPLTVLPLTVHPLTVHPLTVLPLTVLPLTVHPLTVHPLTVHPHSASSQCILRWSMLACCCALGETQITRVSTSSSSTSMRALCPLHTKLVTLVHLQMQ